MDVKMEDSGELSANAQVTTVRTYYKGMILVNGTGAIASVAIHNCASDANGGSPSAANMVAELSLPAVDGDCIVDNPTGVIECPNGIRAVKTTGTVKFHVRYCAQPK